MKIVRACDSIIFEILGYMICNSQNRDLKYNRITSSHYLLSSLGAFTIHMHLFVVFLLITCYCFDPYSIFEITKFTGFFSFFITAMYVLEVYS